MRSHHRANYRVGNFDTPVLDPASTPQLLPESSPPSYVELPIIP